MKKECEHIGRYISQIYRKGGAFISKELSDLGIGSGQVMFLLELYRGDGKNQEEIADALNIDKGTTARAIQKLEKEGFLTREKDKIDKRAYKVYLSEKGKSAKDTIYNMMDKLEEKRTANLNEEEKNTLIILLKKICTKM